MPSNYKRISNRNSWSEESMARALEAVGDGSLGFLSAAKTFGVPKSTLERRFKNANKIAKGTSKKLGSRRLTFPIELEQKLVEYTKKMEMMLYGLTTRTIRSLAFQLAEINNIEHNFNKNSQLAGWHWLRSFLQRNKLSLRLPEATSAARARGFNKQAVASFFDILEPLQDKMKFPPNRVFNVDETGLTTVQGRPSKVVALRGRKQVGTLTSAEHGELSTAVICMSASGVFIPPMIIFPRVHMQQHFMHGVPPGTLGAAHKSGWMQTDLFSKWFDHFLVHSQASKDNPALLILDGHKTHTQNIAVIEKARENGVTILCLPPHCSHRMQPLDVSFMAPLTTFYTEQVEVWLRQNPGKCVTLSQIGSLFGQAYLQASTPLNAINGFRKTGTYPVNRTVFTDDMFVASLPTEKPLNEPFEDHGVVSEELPENPGPAEITKESTAVKQILQPAGLVRSKGMDFLADEDIRPSTSKIQSYISPQKIAPFPKVADNGVPKKTRKVKKGKAAILTSSPYKEELERSFKEQEGKKKKVSIKDINASTKIKSLHEDSRNKKTPGIRTKNKTKSAAVENTEVTRGKRKKFMKRESSSESESEVDDVECLFCCNRFLEDKPGEGWIKCSGCCKWAHDACAGAEDDEDTFVCDVCRFV